jgi:hypothetical protein
MYANNILDIYEGTMWVRVMVFNATFNIISVILWPSILFYGGKP